jgi:hypothetical protein
VTRSKILLPAVVRFDSSVVFPRRPAYVPAINSGWAEAQRAREDALAGVGAEVHSPIRKPPAVASLAPAPMRQSGRGAGSRTAWAQAPESWLAAESESGSGLKSRPATGSGEPAFESGLRGDGRGGGAGGATGVFRRGDGERQVGGISAATILGAGAAVGLAVAVAVAVGRGDAGMGLAGGGVGMAGCRLAGGV